MHLRRAIEDSVQVIQSTRSDQQIHVCEMCLSLYIHYRRGTAVAQCLRCCATNRKVNGSIPNGVTGIFH